MTRKRNNRKINKINRIKKTMKTNKTKKTKKINSNKKKNIGIELILMRMMVLNELVYNINLNSLFLRRV